MVIKKVKENTPVWAKFFLTGMTIQTDHAGLENPKGVVIKKIKENTSVRRKFFRTGMTS